MGARTAAHRLALRAAHRGLRVWWFVRRPHGHGVKAVLLDAGAVLLVRHTYGDRAVWELPGGGLRRGEEPLAAVRREVAEELALAPAVWKPLGEALLTSRTTTTTLHAFAAAWDGTPPRTDPAEIAEARWWPRDALPARRGSDVAGLVARAAAALPQSRFSAQ